MKVLAFGGALLAIAFAAAPVRAADAPGAGLPAGHYDLDRSHASLLFRVNHLGFSMFTARFTRFDADLELDPAQPENAQLTATIDAASLETDYPHPEELDFNKMLQNETWLNTGPYPEITYKARKIEMTGPDSAKIHGVLTLRGVAKPVTLDAKFNGGWKGIPQDPNARIGFSARGRLKRSDFGVDFGIPAPGATMGVSDEVELILEAEFTGPPMQDKPSGE